LSFSLLSVTNLLFMRVYADPQNIPIRSSGSTFDLAAVIIWDTSTPAIRLVTECFVYSVAWADY